MSSPRPFCRSCRGPSAQSAADYRAVCTLIGTFTPEPIGTDQTIIATSNTCRAEGGPLDGAVATVHSVWKWEKGDATVVSQTGVWRKPGTIAVFETTDGRMSLIMKDGKPAGWTQTSKTTFKLATGAAASWAGKTYTTQNRSTGPGQFVADIKID